MDFEQAPGAGWYNARADEPEAPEAHGVSETPERSQTDTLAQVARILNLIRPAIQADGGDVELIDVDEAGIVRIRLHGACVGCPSSSMTLKLGIERNLREHVPEVAGVEAVDA